MFKWNRRVKELGGSDTDSWNEDSVGTNAKIVGDQKLIGGGRRDRPIRYTWGFGRELVESGKRTWKIVVQAGPGNLNAMFVGVAPPGSNPNFESYPPTLPGGRFLSLYDGALYGGGKQGTDLQGYNVVKDDDEIELHLDADTGGLGFYLNGTPFGPGFAAEEVDVGEGLVLAVGLAYAGQAVTIV